MINWVTGSPYLLEAFVFLRFCPAVHGPRLIHYPCHPQTIFSLHLVLNTLDRSINSEAASIFKKVHKNIWVKLGPCHSDIYKTAFPIHSVLNILDTSNRVATSL